MRKDIRRIGSSTGIIFHKEEVENYNLDVGKVIDIQKFRLLKKKKIEEKDGLEARNT